jgi:phage shock protein A
MANKEYEQLKNEYKKHYKKLNEMKQKLMQAKHTQRIAQALEDMDPKPVLQSVDDMIEVIRDKAAQWEAKLTVALSDTYENFSSSEPDTDLKKVAEFEQMQKRQDIKNSINEIKQQMENLKIEADPNKMPAVEKSIGDEAKANSHNQLQDIMDVDSVKKTLGRKS